MARQHYKSGPRSARSKRRMSTSLLFTWGRKHIKKGRNKSFSLGGLSNNGHRGKGYGKSGLGAL